MNPAHIHLLVNHVSLFGVFFGFAALAWSLIKGSRDMLFAAILLFVISGIFSWIAMETGEGAEEIVEKLPGVIESLIKNHEEAAEVANVSIMILAFGALAMGIAGRFKTGLLKPAQIIVLILALVSGGLLVRTANLGGQIRHTEIQANVPLNSAGENGAGEKDEDDD